MRILVLALSLSLLALPALPAAGSGATPPAPAPSNDVQLVSVQGLPNDSLVRERFMSGFRDAFTEASLAAERPTGAGEWAPSAPVANHFQWLEGDPSADAWTLQVVLGSPAAAVLRQRADEHGRRSLVTHRRSRGMIAALTVQAPDPGDGPPPPVQERFAFAFPAAGTDSGAVLSMPGVGYLFPWNDAGRVVARLALEVMHHERGDLERDARLAIAPALRTEAGR